MKQKIEINGCAVRLRMKEGLIDNITVDRVVWIASLTQSKNGKVEQTFKMKNGTYVYVTLKKGLIRSIAVVPPELQ